MARSNCKSEQCYELQASLWVQSSAYSCEKSTEGKPHKGVYVYFLFTAGEKKSRDASLDKRRHGSISSGCSSRWNPLPPAWVASARGGSRDRGLHHQSGVTRRLHQGVEVEASGPGGLIRSTFARLFAMHWKGTGRKAVPAKTGFCPSEEGRQSSTGCRVWGWQRQARRCKHH